MLHDWSEPEAPALVVVVFGAQPIATIASTATPRTTLRIRQHPSPLGNGGKGSTGVRADRSLPRALPSERLRGDNRSGDEPDRHDGHVPPGEARALQERIARRIEEVLHGEDVA